MPLLAGVVAVGLILVGALLIWGASRPVTGVRSRWFGHRRRGAQTAPGTPPPEWIYGDRTSRKSQTSAAAPHPAGVAQIPEPAAGATSRGISAPAVAVADQIVKEAEQKAREIVAAAEDERERLLSEARASVERALADARREADAIVEEAEQQTRDILAAASRAQTQLNQAVAREQALVDEKRRLSELVFGMLKELDRTSGLEAVNVRDLGEARELRGQSRSAE